MNTKQLVMPILTTAILTAGLLSSGNVYAAEDVVKANPFAALVEKISTTFNLDTSKVQAVVDQFHQEQKTQRQAEMKARQEEYLNTLVSEGKITEAQKQAIIKKTAELKASFKPGDMRNKTEEERIATMEKRHAEITAWAESQGINPEYLRFGGHGEKMIMRMAPMEK